MLGLCPQLEPTILFRHVHLFRQHFAEEVLYLPCRQSGRRFTQLGGLAAARSLAVRAFDVRRPARDASGSWPPRWRCAAFLLFPSWKIPAASEFRPFAAAVPANCEPLRTQSALAVAARKVLPGPV